MVSIESRATKTMSIGFKDLIGVIANVVRVQKLCAKVDVIILWGRVEVSHVDGSTGCGRIGLDSTEQQSIIFLGCRRQEVTLLIIGYTKTTVLSRVLGGLSLDRSKLWDLSNCVFEHSTLDRGGEMVCCGKEELVLPDLVLPVKEETMGFAFPRSITELS